LWSCGGKGSVTKTAARPTDNERSSVDRTQLSDTGVGDELAVVGQVTRGVAVQGPVDERRNLEHDALRRTGSTGEIRSHRLVLRLIYTFFDAMYILQCVFFVFNASAGYAQRQVHSVVPMSNPLCSLKLCSYYAPAHKKAWSGHIRRE